MMRSLYSAVAGLKNHQIKMDVIGNNIANVNTVAYKPSRVIFQDIYSQTLRPASGPDNNVAKIGGRNPNQVGLGMTISTIDIMQTKATTQITGEALDLCIEGDGYFIVNVNNENVFTRAGNFYLDASNHLVTQSGSYVMGFCNEQIKRDPVTTATATYYELNTPTPWDPATADTDPFPTGLAITDVKPITIDPNYKDINISSAGEIIGTHKDTGEQHIIGKVMLATFDNPGGLEKLGANLYRQTRNSGTSEVCSPGEAAAGMLNPGGLEMANVDIAQEFSDMITTQRGFQANSRIITVSDSMLEELINLKR